MKAYDNKTALLKSVLNTVMDPPGGLNQVNRTRTCNFGAAQNLVSEHTYKRFQLPIALSLQTVPDPFLIPPLQTH